MEHSVAAALMSVETIQDLKNDGDIGGRPKVDGKICELVKKCAWDAYDAWDDRFQITHENLFHIEFSLILKKIPRNTQSESGRQLD